MIRPHVAQAPKGITGSPASHAQRSQWSAGPIHTRFSSQWLRRLGLIYEITIHDADVEVVFSLTTPGCPIGPRVAMQMVELVGALDGVRGVTPRLVFQPRWSKERLSEDARFALGL